jgi:hypothetical protein
MPNIRRVMDLSTEHLPRAMRDELLTYTREADAPSWGGASGVYPTEYGALVWVPDNPEESSANGEEPVPPILLAIQKYARQHECDYVLFDADASVDDALEIFPFDEGEEEAEA